MPRVPKSLGSHDPQRHNPLAEEYAPSDPFKHKSAKRQKRTKSNGEEEQNFVDSKSSRRILDIGRELEEEDERERERKSRSVQLASNPAFDFASRLGEDGPLDDEAGQFDDDDEAWGEEEEEVEEVEIDANDLAAWNKFIPTDDNPIVWPGEEAVPQGPGTDLAALILDKIAEYEASTGGLEQREILGGGAPEDAIELPPKVVEVYTKVGLILSRYKSGKLPKPFKILPTLPTWETLLAITRPDSWTPHAVFAATRIFISRSPLVAQIFLRTVLLPALQDNIRATRKLNVYLYAAMKKALYKPASFFKGVVFPLLTEEGCTQREATIVASVITRVSVPVLHSAAALHRLCEIAAEHMSVDLEAGGSCNIFIKTLLEKKYALPYKVVDALVFHFLRFRTALPPSSAAGNAEAMETDSVAGDLAGRGEKLPVIWHQCLLAFAQRYRNDVTEDQREALLDLLLSRGHKRIGPEVRRELLEGRGRGVVVEPGVAGGGSTVGVGGDDTMVMG